MHNPDIKEVLSLPVPGSAVLSENGKYIAYTLENPDFRENVYEKKCLVACVDSGKTIHLTRSGVASNIRWIGDDSVALIHADSSKKEDAQAYLFENLAGIPIPLTDHKGGIESFELYEDGLLYIAKDPDHLKGRKSRYGDMIHNEKEDSATNLYYLNKQKINAYRSELKKTDKKSGDKIPKPVLNLKHYLNINRSITSLIIPNSRKNQFVINTQKRDDIYFSDKTLAYKMVMDIEKSLSLYVESEQDEKKEGKEPDCFGEYQCTPLNLPIGSNVESYSPDDSKLLIRLMFGDQLFYKQEDLSWISFHQLLEEDTIGVLKNQNITKEFDRDFYTVKWRESGIYLSYPDYSTNKICRFDLNGRHKQIGLDSYLPECEFSIYDDTIAVVVSNAENYFEVAYHKNGKTKILTQFNNMLTDWKVGKPESITWKSKDGLEIEGVLRKPVIFDPKKQYPLVFIVHGGPDDSSNVVLLNKYLSRYYPAIQFLNQDILVLEPNYRGSVGRGKAFKEKYKDNIGFGDMGDLESAIDFLSKKGFVDGEKVGCMGWSQGGYISAFVSTHSIRFAATSVGAGVASWKTYYDSNDIRQWAVHYLGGSPMENPDYYKTTAPVNNIKNANTPTLIQHGELDQRCPVANAKELNRALIEAGVPTELFLFKGMPHGITKPRENLAILHQNLNWFSHYLLGKELDLA